MNYLFLHGLGQRADCWQETVRGMQENSNDEIICLELAALLQGGKFTYEALYQALVRYCETLTGPIAICGLSLGGILALQYGIEHPERVDSLVLIGVQYVMPKSLLRLQNALFRLMPEKMFGRAGIGKKEMIELSRSMIDLDFTGALSGILCKVLIICGEKDRANRKAACALEEKIPAASLCLIENAGHEVNVEAPEELGRQLKAFFAREKGILQ